MHLQTRKKIIGIVSIGLILTACIIVVIVMKFAHDKNTKKNNHAQIITKKIVVNNYTFNFTHGPVPEKGLLIYISDSISPNLTTSYAKQFAELSYYVATIDSQLLLASIKNAGNQCVQLAEELKTISQQLQKSFNIDSNELPILVGDKEGAALVYAALAQTDKHYFHAGLSINFTPHINTNAPLCLLSSANEKSSTTMTHLSPQGYLSTNWYVFQSALIAKNVESTEFIEQVGNAKLTITKNINTNSINSDTDPITQATQILQWLDPRISDQVTSNNTESSLPIIEIPAEVISPQILAVLITGDGGWAEIDKQVAKILAEKGIPTVALDALSYFWRARTPEETAKHIDNVISQYREKWNTKKVILIGYSFGADVLPFIANKLSERNKTDVALVALLAMGKTAAFEFRLSSWINADTNANRLPILPELKSMHWANSICIYGTDDKETGCIQTSELGVKTISMAGDHHFNENYDLLVQHIIENSQ